MIVFSGLDGAGKSTQISLLHLYFQRNGVKSIIFWSRGGYTPGISFLKKLLRKSGNKKIISNTGPSEERSNLFKKTFIRKTWIFLAIIDLIFFYGVYFRVKEFFGTKIICDRYIIDTAIDFKLNFKNEKIENWLIWRVLLIVCKKPKRHFVLTISVNESMKRSKLKNEPFPDSEQTLTYRLNDYLNFVNSDKHVVHIDGFSSIQNTHRFILRKLK